MSIPTKEACCILLDVGRSMGVADANGETPLEVAKKAVRHLIQSKLLQGKQDEVALITYGSKATNNTLNENEGGYEHVNVLCDLGPASLQLLTSVDEAECDDCDADFVDALVVAAHMIVEKIAKKKYLKRIFLVTDGGTQTNDDKLDDLIDVFGSNGIKLNVIGIGFQSEDDADEEVDEEGKKERRKKKAAEAGRTDIHINNEIMLTDICTKLGVNGEWYTFHDAMQIMSFMRSKTVRQTTKLRGDFHLNSTVKFPVWTFAKTSEQRMPSLKKFSTIAGDESGIVKQERTYYNKLDEERKNEIDKNDAVRAYPYGTSLVSGMDKDSTKFLCEKGIWLLGFCSPQQVPRHHYLGSTDVVVAEPDSIHAAVSLSAIIHALAELNRVAIVRYVKRTNGGVNLAVCSPVIKSKFECLYLNILPFREDYREFSFASFKDIAFQPSAAQLKCARDVIENMNLDDAAEGEEALKPKRTFNPTVQRLYQCLERRALDPQAAVEELDPFIASYVNPDEKILHKAAPSIQRFKDAFPLVRVEEKKAKKRRHWRDFLYEQGELDEDLAALKKAKPEEKKEMKFDDVVSSAVNEIGTIDPVKDFKAMIARRDDAEILSKAISQMVDMIKSLVRNSLGDAFYAKALQCLLALREACVQQEEPTKFNSALKDMKHLFAEKKKNFWKLVQDQPVYPISTTEVEESDYTHEQAIKFYEAPLTLPSLELSIPATADQEEDVMDALE